MMKTLVGFDTVSSKSNRCLIDWIADCLASSGVQVEVLALETDSKASLFATIGPKTPGEIAQTHQTNEFIALHQFYAGEQLLRRSRAYTSR